MALTPRREQFAINLAKGMKQIKAFEGAGYSMTGSRNAIYARASALAHKPEIVARYNELLARAQDDAVASVLERKRKLTEIIRSDIKEPVKPEAVISAISEHNRMEKVYTEHEPPGEFHQTFVFVLPDGTRVLPNQMKELPVGDSDREAD